MVYVRSAIYTSADVGAVRYRAEIVCRVIDFMAPSRAIPAFPGPQMFFLRKRGDIAAEAQLWWRAHICNDTETESAECKLDFDIAAYLEEQSRKHRNVFNFNSGISSATDLKSIPKNFSVL